MQALLEQVLAAHEAGEACVLCTVVRLDGSGYGRPGARLFISESGDRLGFISGGCLEKDLCRRVWQATAAGPKLIAFDTMGNSVDVPRYNTGCEGVVYVFCQRIYDTEAGVIRRILDAYTHDKEIRLLTVYRSDTAEANAGDSWLIDVNDKNLHQTAATVGNGDASLNGRAAAAAVNTTLIDKLQAAQGNSSFALRDACGNVMEAAIEIISPPPRLIIFGAGDDVIPLVSASVALDWRVTVVGHRAELAHPLRFPGAEVLCGPMHDVAKQLMDRKSHFSDRTDVVVMTHDFDRDVELMHVLLESPARSIGLLGPKRRLGRLVTRMHQQGRRLSERDIDRIRSPLGLDIGAISPAEIATSIVAELIALSRVRQGGFLHARRQPLHPAIEHERISTERMAADEAEAIAR